MYEAIDLKLARSSTPPKRGRNKRRALKVRTPSRSVAGSASVAARRDPVVVAADIDHRRPQRHRLASGRSNVQLVLRSTRVHAGAGCGLAGRIGRSGEALERGPTRNGALMRRVQGISQRMPTETLRELEELGIVRVTHVLRFRPCGVRADLARAICARRGVLARILDRESHLRDEAGNRRDARRTPGAAAVARQERSSSNACANMLGARRHLGFLQITDESRSLLQLRLLGVEVVGSALDAVNGRQTFHIGPHERFHLLSAPI